MILQVLHKSLPMKVTLKTYHIIPNDLKKVPEILAKILISFFMSTNEDRFVIFVPFCNRYVNKLLENSVDIVMPAAFYGNPHRVCLNFYYHP